MTEMIDYRKMTDWLMSNASQSECELVNVWMVIGPKIILKYCLFAVADRPT
jgi:hypothetical protein